MSEIFPAISDLSDQTILPDNDVYLYINHSLKRHIIDWNVFYTFIQQYVNTLFPILVSLQQCLILLFSDNFFF